MSNFVRDVHVDDKKHEIVIVDAILFGRGLQRFQHCCLSQGGLTL